jgi:kynurenine formamidase
VHFLLEVVDLTQPIEDGMPVYPDDAQTHLYQSKFLELDKHNNYRLEISMHSGTHIDSAMHLTKSKEYISEIPITNFTGNGCILDVRNQQVIKMQKQYEHLIENQRIVLLYTGYDRFYGTTKYYEEHPIVDAEFCAFLAAKNIKMLGVDMPSPDYYPFQSHQLLFQNRICIIENLVNLDKLLAAEKFEVFALPLKIKADSSLARVVARIF